MRSTFRQIILVLAASYAPSYSHRRKFLGKPDLDLFRVCVLEELHHRRSGEPVKERLPI